MKGAGTGDGHNLSSPIRKCNDCGLNEFETIAIIKWARKRHMFIKCMGCGEEFYYMEDRPSDRVR